MTASEIKDLQEISRNIRRDIIDSLCEAGSGHIGGSLDLADIFTVLYFHTMNHNPQNPQMPSRDKLVLSIGHAAPVLYATLANAGYFPKEELKSLRKIGGRLQGHPSFAAKLQGIESASGSLGQGLSICVGMALSDKIDGCSRKIFCVCGDGEIQEGEVWEAAMSAAHHKLSNIIAIVDRNRLQIDGPNDEVMQLEPLRDKWQSFGWSVYECNDNDIEELAKTFDGMSGDKPKVLIANTTMGKGVSQIEGKFQWHGKAPNATERDEFLHQLDSLQ